MHCSLVLFVLASLQLLVLVRTEDEAVQNTGELSGVGSSDSWIVDIVTDDKGERMFMTCSPEVDGPAKTIGISVSSETASDSAPLSKDVVPSVALGPILSVAGSKVTGKVDEEGFFFSFGKFT